MRVNVKITAKKTIGYWFGLYVLDKDDLVRRVSNYCRDHYACQSSFFKDPSDDICSMDVVPYGRLLFRISNNQDEDYWKDVHHQSRFDEIREGDEATVRQMVDILINMFKYN